MAAKGSEAWAPGSAGMAPSARPSPSGASEGAEGDDGARQHRFSLEFATRSLEGQFAAEQSAARKQVLRLVMCFDLAMFVVRGAFKLLAGQVPGMGLLQQLANMVLLYSALYGLNARSRRAGSHAAHQEEAVLCCLIAGVISLLLLGLRPGNASDYVYAALFLTCTSAVLKLRWLVGTLALAVPVAVAAATNLCLRWPSVAAPAGGVCSLDGAIAADTCAAGSWMEVVAVGPLPLEALVHILVAWAVGALMAFVSDSNRRQSFLHHQLALGAAGKELGEVQTRMLMERELAQAQQQAAARALVLAKEKAANEAKSEFMSLMCHEVRTPLNGCLASAEMLLETELDEEQRDLAKTIRVSGSILLSTVSNFLDFFKIEAGKQLDIVRSPLDLQDLVTDVHCIIEAMVGKDSGVALLAPDCDGAPSTVLGDPSRICGILLNLYTNAAKYTKRGSIGLRVRVVGANYRPDPTAALAFCDATGGPSTAGGTGGPTGQASRASRSMSASMPDSAANTSRSSTPTGVLGGPAGRADGTGAAGGRTKLNGPAPTAAAAAASAAVPHMLYHAEHDSAVSLAAAGKASSGPGAADGAAALLNRQAEAAVAGVPHAIMSSVTEVDGWCSVHSQADPHFVLRHARTRSAQACAPGSSSEEEGETVGGGAMGERQRFLCFEVMDTGVGVTRKALESLFQDYVQGTDSEMQRPRARGGTGLGLSICCKQVAVLGGAIGALSKPSCGSVFWFTTPLLLPPNGSSSAESLEQSEEEEAAEAAANAADPTPSQVAGAAAIRRSLEPNAPPAGGRPNSAAEEAARDSTLPTGISTGHRQHSMDSGLRRPASGSRRQSMESDLSSMWPSHKSPMRESSGGPLEEDCAAHHDPSYHPRHALSWEQPAQPPSFTAAEMLQSMPLAAAGMSSGSAASAAAAARPAPTGRASLSGAVAHMGAARHHIPPPSGAGAGAVASVREAAARQRQSNASALQGLRVLLAEDNLINQTVAKRVLTNLGCECRVASNGREAVMAVEEAAAGGCQFDVILMDMCMPVLGGVEATQEIRGLGCGVPIVAMTANASERDRVECIAAGMDGFLSKPVLKEQLSVAIREAIAEGGHRH